MADTHILDALSHTRSLSQVGSTIARETDAGIHLHAGPEIGVASTKAFTAQVATLTTRMDDTSNF